MPVFGLIASIAVVAVVMLGLPAQIHKTYKSQGKENMALPLLCFLFIAYSCWSIYGWTKEEIDWYLAIAYTPGVLLSGILLIQYFYYKHWFKLKE